MGRHRLGPLLVVVVLLVVVAVLTAAALPALVAALGIGLVALVAGAGGRRARRARGLVAETRWEQHWDAPPPVDTLPDARRQAAAVLAGWGVAGEAAEPALLVVTELLSNAVEHARGPAWLSLELVDDAVHVAVCDGAPEPPRLVTADPLRARGRGLHVVDALATQWGSTADLPGKVVWAVVPTRWPD